MLIHPTSIIHPDARLAEGVTVGPYSIISENVHIGRGTKIGAHAVIKPFVKIGCDNEIYQFASIGEVPQDLKFGGEETWLEIGDRNRIREFTTLNRGTVGGGGATKIGSDCLIMSYAHVAHDCVIEDRVILANSVQMAGHVHIYEQAIIGGGTVIHQFVRVGEHSMVGGGSALPQDIAPYMIAAGNRAELSGLNIIGLTRRGFSAESIASLKKAYKMLFRSGLTVKDAVNKIREEVPPCAEVNRLIEFVTTSERGVCR